METTVTIFLFNIRHFFISYY